MKLVILTDLPDCILRYCTDRSNILKALYFKLVAEPILSVRSIPVISYEQENIPFNKMLCIFNCLLMSRDNMFMCQHAKSRACRDLIDLCKPDLVSFN